MPIQESTQPEYERSGGQDAATSRGSSWGAFFWRRQTLMFAILFSLFVHVALLLITAFLDYGGGGPSLELVGREVEMAVMSDEQLTQMMGERLEADSSPAAQLQEPEIQIDDFDAPVAEEALASFDIEAGLEIDGMGAGLTEGLELTGAGGGGSARFFGVEASGSRFAYIVDVSGSMQGDRLAALRQALVDSVDGLLEHTHYSIFLYESDAIALTGARWLPATKRHKVATVQQIRSIGASGGTRPLPAFQLAFGMKPQPDAVYFMTDGQFTEDAADEIVSMVAGYSRAERSRTPIHCISFITRDSEPLMRRIARQSGGTYTHVEGP